MKFNINSIFILFLLEYYFFINFLPSNLWRSAPGDRARICNKEEQTTGRGRSNEVIKNDHALGSIELLKVCEINDFFHVVLSLKIQAIQALKHVKAQCFTWCRNPEFVPSYLVSLIFISLPHHACSPITNSSRRTLYVIT